MGCSKGMRDQIEPIVIELKREDLDYCDQALRDLHRYRQTAKW